MTKKKYQEEVFDNFCKKYQILRAGAVHPDDEYIYLGEKEKKKRTCKYCSKSWPDTSFKKIAHAFPVLMGNKKLIDNLECDKCNEHFSKYLENELANYINPARTLSRIKGRTGVPKYKDHETSFQVSFENLSDMQIVVPEGKWDSAIDLENSRIKIEMKRAPYHPVAIYKTFLKMAISVMPEEYLPEMSENIAWLLREDHVCLVDHLPFFEWFVNGPVEPYTLTYGLCKAKEDGICRFTFFFSISNYHFQIPIPTRAQVGKELSLPLMPPMISAEYVEKFGEPIRKKLDFFCNQRRVDEPFVAYIHFGEIHEIPVSTTSIIKSEPT